MDSYSNYGIIIPVGKTNGEVASTCPQCSHTRKKKTAKCLGINLDKKVWFCSHCGWGGALKMEREEIKVYEKPTWKNKTELSNLVVKWFEGRKISQKTLLDMKISEGLEWMPQIAKEINTIQFNYFRNGELINVKYRDGSKNFKLHKGAELIFYNIDTLNDCEDIYLVEGEIDCLSLIESGFKNVISVPNGANLNSNNLTYLDTAIDLFNGKNIYLAFDNDIAGRKLRDDIADRFGKDRCEYIEFKDCKDANECLQKYGINGVIESCGNKLKFPLEGVFTISDIDNDIEDMYVNGLDKGVSTKIEGFDLNIVKGYITVVTGIPSHGKSEWVDNMCLKLLLHHGWKGAFYSPENKPTQLHFSKMARRLIGKHWDGQNRITHAEKNLVKRFLDNKIWFLKPTKDFTLQTILGQIRDLQKRHGLEYFVIDAWNKLEHIGDADTNYIGKCLDEIAMFCELNNIHCFLVAHPTKMKTDQTTMKKEVPTLYSIAGSANFYNKADNGICVYRDFDKGLTYVYRQKIKFDHWGTDGFSEYKYDLDSKRYIYNDYIDTSNWISNEMKQTELPISEKSAIQPNIEFNKITPSKNDEWEEKPKVYF